MIKRLKSVSTRNNIVARPSTVARKSAGTVSGTALAVGLSLITAQAALAEMATLTVLDIKAVSVSAGTDGATTALFGALGAAATAAAAVATLGASVPITASVLAGAAATGASSGVGAGKILGDTFQGADDLYFTIDGAAVWPPEAYSRTIDTGETEQVNMSFEFDNQVGVTLELWERDTASANDSMGQQQFKRMLLPYQDQIVIADTGEKSMYLVNVRITAQDPNCADFYTEQNGGGAHVRVCAEDWPAGAMSPYLNLGTPGTNSHHYAVQSFRCNSGLTLIQFINGNANPQTGHPENCVAGTIVNTNPWVKTGGATGVSFYRG